MMPRRNRSRPAGPKPGRYQPQTGQVARCEVCGHLYTPEPGYDGSLCLSCREQPGLFPRREASS